MCPPRQPFVATTFRGRRERSWGALSEARVGDLPEAKRRPSTAGFHPIRLNNLGAVAFLKRQVIDLILGNFQTAIRRQPGWAAIPCAA